MISFLSPCFDVCLYDPNSSFASGAFRPIYVRAISQNKQDKQNLNNLL